MRLCAFCGLFQSAGSSALAFSSASRFWAASMSKMPPQQCQRLLDLIDNIGGFRAHRSSLK
jgi:hypothetical protein